MKIIRSNHDILTPDSLSNKDVGIGYVERSHMETKCVMALNPLLTMAPEKREVLPGQMFSSPDVYLFGENEQLCQGVSMSRKSEGYQYIPDRSFEFYPTSFSLSIKARRNGNYSAATHYPIQITADADNSLIDSIVAALGDAGARGICPTNISFNDGHLRPETLADLDPKSADFIFIETKTGICYNDDTTIIPIGDLLDADTIPWLLTTNWPGTITSTSGSYTLAQAKLYNTATYSSSCCKCIPDAVSSAYPATLYRYHSLFSGNAPALLLERISDGAKLLVSHEDFFTLASSHPRLIFEIIAQTYLSANLRSRVVRSWITDDPVDRLCATGDFFRKKHEDIVIADCFKESMDNLTLLAMETSPTWVVVTNIENGKIHLEKQAAPERDPEKAEGWSSCLTAYQSVILYRPQVINTIETGVSYLTNESSTGEQVIILPCKSTKQKLNLVDKTTLRIPERNRLYRILIQDSYLQLMPDEEANESLPWLGKVASMEVGEPKLLDIRVAGGGTPGVSLDCSLTDIGEMRGRPIRRGSTLIVKIPTKYQEYAKEIRQALMENCGAGEVPILYFAD